jgi:ribonuclease HI
MGVKNIWLEGDSKNIVDCIKGITQSSWTISNIIEETRANLKKFEKAHITHIFREANPMADWLANDGVRKERKKTWLLGRDLPCEAKSIINHDKIMGSTAEIKGQLWRLM